MRSALARRARTALLVFDTFFDDFNRADSSSLGPSYFSQSGVAIVSNKVNIPGNVTGVAMVLMNAADKYVRGKFMGTSSGGGGTGLYVDYLDSNNYARLLKNSPSYYQRIVGGSIQFQHNLPYAYSDNDIMEIRISGTTVYVYRNGWLIDSFTDSYVNGAKKYAFFSINSAFGNVDIDNFEVDNAKSPVLTFMDSFNRSNGGVGTGYASGTTANVVSNKASSTSGAQVLNLPYDGYDFDLSFDLTSASSGLYAIPGSGAAASFVYDPAGTVQFRSRIDGSLLYSAASGTTTTASLRYTIVGNVYSIYVNDVLKLQHDFGAHTRTGSLEIDLYTDQTLDNLSYGNASAPVSKQLGGVNSDQSITVDAFNGNDRYAFPFTVTESIVVDSIAVAVSNQGGDLLAGAKIGIATGITGATTTATFLTSKTLTSALAKNGYRTVTMDKVVQLDPGTTYWYVLEGVSDNGFGVLFTTGTGAPTLQGIINAASGNGLGTSARVGTGNYSSTTNSRTAFKINP